MTARTHFDQELEKVHLHILKMGSMVEEAIDKAIEALIKQDEEMANAVIDGDDKIDEMEVYIENECVRLIATQQPIARDLRTIFTAIKLITDLERIADHAVDIAKNTKRLVNEVYIKPLIDIPRIADIVKHMLRDALTSYINTDVDLAMRTCKLDDQVDGLHAQIYRELIALMLEDPRNIKQATHFLFISSYLERVADHATNICEWVIFVETGEHKDLND